ncbi:MAG: xanthine dehydrogenase small subunit [Chlorobi bacterium]|nr:xanthine dehydrogenase small subunit [Chlorobiota bacterium]
MDKPIRTTKGTSGKVQFVLDNQIISIDFEKQNLKPTTTLLNYLRSLPAHKGVKEGCAEGDCGACTVVIAELQDGKINYKALNSCLVFLPMIHGKQIITVENLAERNGYDVELHPVQKALVETGGSQCGYCTPGFTMSMFAMYKDNSFSNREEIENTLAGNLCRCTGYQPIIKATEISLQYKSTDQFDSNVNATIGQLQQINQSGNSLLISAKDQFYFQPQNLTELLELRKSHPDAILINGSTDIALRQTKKFEHLGKILDMSAVQELQELRETENEIVFGSGLSLEDVRLFAKQKLDALHGLLNVFASKQIRNLATLGGNVGTASPISDTLPLLFAYKAKLRLVGTNRSRELAIEDFITGYRKTALRDDEIILSVSIPKPEKDTVVKFYKVSKRKDLDISTVSAGFSLKLKNGIVEKIILAFGGMAAVTSRAIKAESFLLGKDWNRENTEKAVAILKSEFNPISDARSGKEFRNMAAGNLLLKFASTLKL